MFLVLRNPLTNCRKTFHNYRQALYFIYKINPTVKTNELLSWELPRLIKKYMPNWQIVRYI